MKKILLIFVLILFCINFVSAGNEIIGYMSQKIYEDCQGQDINAEPLGLIYIPTNDPIPTIKWPYDIQTMQAVVKVIIENEPYSITLTKNSQGTTLLDCGEKKLTANFYTYKWDGERLDPFIYNTKQITNQVVNQIANMEGSYKSQLIQSIGNENINITKQNNWLSDNLISLTINIVITLIIISFAWKFFIKKKFQLRTKESYFNNSHN